MAAITLIQVFHDALPAGAADEEAAALYERAWKPLIESLFTAPQVRAALFVSGRMCEWLERGGPEAIDRLRTMVQRGQIEMLGGSRYGAVLHCLPDRDAVAQLAVHAAWLKKHLAAPVRGAWLACGAWDPDLPRVLAKAGVRYTFVDAGLVASSGVPRRKLQGWALAERRGAGVGVFPIDRRLSSMVPWGSPTGPATELRIRGVAGVRVITSAVAVEALGLRDESHARCWGERAWIADLLRTLSQNSGWLKTGLPWQAVERTRPQARVYPSAGTSPAMAAASLPVDAAASFHQLHDTLDAGSDPVLADAGRWLIGPPWEAVLALRDESNRLHKRMLRASAAVQSLRRRAQMDVRDPSVQATLEVAEDALLRGQSASILHDGPLGCLHRADLWHQAWRWLVDAERGALEALGAEQPDPEHVDFDCDGHKELLISTPTMQAVIRPAKGAVLSELHVAGLGNIINVLARRPAPWHDLLGAAERLPSVVSEAPEFQASPDEDLFTLEDTPMPQVQVPRAPRLPALQAGLHELVANDRRERVCFREHLFGPGVTLDNLRRDQAPEIGDFFDGEYRVERCDRGEHNMWRARMVREGTVTSGRDPRLLHMAKELRLHPTDPLIRTSYDLTNRFQEPIQARFGVQLNLGVDGFDGGRRSLRLPFSKPLPLSTQGERAGVSDVAIDLPDHGVALVVRCSAPAHIYYFPVLLPAREVAGYRRSFQGTCVMLTWDLGLWGDERHHFDVGLRVMKR